MKSLVTAQHGQVLLANGNVTIEIANGKQSIAPGEQLPKGSTLYIEDGAEVEIAFEDGTTYSNLSSGSQDSEEAITDTDLSALDEIQALQDLIASGEDPTAGLPDTAAGAGTAGNQGGTDFISLSRSGDETIASSGFATDGSSQSEFSADGNIDESVIDNPSELIDDTITIDEDGVATGNVLDNDSDVDSDLSVITFEVNGDTYSVGTEVTLEGGTLVISEDGSYTFTPNENWNGSVPVITYTTNTGSTATLTIEVTPVDDASVLANDSNTIDEDSIATGNVLDNDSDVDDELTVASFEVNGTSYTAGTEVTLEGGTLVIGEDGSYTFTPNENWNGSVPVITYTTNTGSTATLTIEVNPVDDASVLANDSNTISEDSVARGNVLSNDSDVDNELTVTSFAVNGSSYTAGTQVTLAGGSLVLNSNGNYTFTPNEDWNGSVPVITYTTNTGSTATLSIVVSPVNDAPIAENDSFSVAEGEMVGGNVITHMDGDGIQDSDGGDGAALFVTQINGSDLTFGQDGWASVDVTNGTLRIQADGTFEFTHDGSEPTQTDPSFTYTISDGSDVDTATVTFSVGAVNDKPLADNDSFSVDEGEMVSGNVITHMDGDGVQDSDGGDGAALFVTQVNGSDLTFGQDGWVSVDVTNGTLRIKADGSFEFQHDGTDPTQTDPSFTYTISDGSDVDTATVTFSVAPIDDTAPNAPTVTIVDDNNPDNEVLTQAEIGADNVQLRVDVDHDELVDGGSINLIINNSGVTTQLTLTLDADGNPVVVDADDNPVTGFSYTNGVITWNETAPTEGDSITVTATQTDAANNTSGPGSDTATVADETATNAPTVTIVDDNNPDNEVLTQAEIGADNVQLRVDVGHDELVAGGSIKLTVNNSGDTTQLTLTLDADGKPVVVDADDNPVTGFSYTNGVITWTETTPADAQALTVTATQTDAAGNQSNQGSDTATVHLDTTTALSDVVEGTTLDLPDTVTLSGDITTAQGGNVSLINGVYVYTAPVLSHDANGSPIEDSFSYTNTDGSIATFTINVTDTKPVANDDVGNFDVGQGVVTTGSVSLLDNELGDIVDSSVSNPAQIHQVQDANGDWHSLTNGSVTVSGEYGTFTVNQDGSYSYESSLDTYAHAVEGATAVMETFGLYGFTDNSFLTGGDLLLSSLTAAASDLVTSRASGGQSKPGIGVSGDGKDDIGGNESIVIELEVESTSVQIGVNELNANQGDLSWAVYDAEGHLVDSGIFSSSSKNGSLETLNISTLTDSPFQYIVLGYTGNSNGFVIDSIAYSPADGAVSETFDYTVVDNDGTVSEPATVTLDANVDTSTSANNDIKQTSEDIAAQGNVLENDVYIDSSLKVSHFKVNGDATEHQAGNGVIVVKDGNTNIGKLVLNADGEYTFTPSKHWNGEVPEITYTTNTGAEATLTINVTPVNDDTQDDEITVREHDSAIGNVLTGVGSSVDGQDEADNTSVTGFVVGQQTGTIGQAIHVFSETDPSVKIGELTLESDGSYTFSPTEHWSGDVPVVTYTTNTGSEATLTIHVTPVADAPSLTLTNSTNIATLDFENVSVSSSQGWNGNVSTNQLNAVGKWGTNNSSGNLEVGYASTYGASGGTNQVLELEAYGTDNSIYVDITLEAGKLYQLDLDTAARANGGSGSSVADSSDFTIKLTNLDTNEVTLLNSVDFTEGGIWQHINNTLSVEQTGNYRISFEALNANSYGALLDNINLSIVDNKGYEDSFIKLSTINADLVDEDGSESLSLKITGIPVDSVIKGLVNGVETQITVDSSGEVDISDWDLGSLSIKIANTGDYDLTVIATSTEQANDDFASTSVTLPVTVLPLVDYQVDSLSTIEGETLNFSASELLANDTDSSNINLSITGFASDATGGNQIDPTQVDASFTTTLGGTITINADGSYSYQAPTGLDHSSSETLTDSFYYQATDGENSSNWIQVSIDVSDTSPTANDDIDSIGFGGTAYGNAITAVGTSSDGADNIGSDDAQVSSVRYGSDTYSDFDANGNVTITTDDGILVMNQDGSYSYQSTLSEPLALNDTELYYSQGVNLYGFSSNSDFMTGAKLNTSALTGYGEGISHNGVGIGARSNGWINDRESMIIDLESNHTAISLGLYGENDHASEIAGQWIAYNSDGVRVGSGSLRGEEKLEINLSTPYQYVVLTSTSSADFSLVSLQTPSQSETNDQFSYTLTDADGDRDSATLTINQDSSPQASNDTATVAESGITADADAGIHDGTTAGNGSNIATGNLLDNDSGISGSTQITQVEGESAVNGVITVTTALGELTVYTENSAEHRAGDYQYTLTHNTNGDNAGESFDYSLENALGNTSSASLTVNITDDAPIGSDIIQNLTTSAAPTTTNLTLVLDVSGSMNGDAGNGKTYLETAIESLTALINEVDATGNVNIQIIDFQYHAEGSGWLIDDVAGAIAHLNTLVAYGSTNYEAALNAVMSSGELPHADQSLVYFISDGRPSEDYEVNPTLQQDWENYLSDTSTKTGVAGDDQHYDISFGIGIGGAELNYLLPVAHPEVNGNEDYAVKVDNADDLTSTILNYFDGNAISGSLDLLNTANSNGVLIGADGGHVASIVIDGQTHLYNASSPLQVFTTALGGQISLNFETGEYRYSIEVDRNVLNEHESFSITIVDNDGDTATVNLEMDIDYHAGLDANANNIITNLVQGESIDIPLEYLTHGDKTPYDAAITDVTGSNTTLDNSHVTIEGLTDNSSFEYTLHGNDASDSTKVDIDLTNQLTGTAESDIIINASNSTSAIDAQIVATVKSGSNDRTDNQFGVNFTTNAVGLFIASISIDLRAGSDDNAYVQNYKLESDSDLTQSEVSWSLSGDNSVLTAQFDNGAFTSGENLWFTLDTNQLQGGNGGDNGSSFAESQVSFTVTLSDGSSQTGIYLHNAGGAEAKLVFGDVLDGGAGDDVLVGGSGSDILLGGDGDDMLIGGLGDDTLIGGLGGDTFVWEADTSGVESTDHITDFHVGEDKLDLSDLLQGETAATIDQYFDIRVVDGSTIIDIDIDGGNDHNYTQHIVLDNVDLLSNGSITPETAINSLLANGALIISNSTDETTTSTTFSEASRSNSHPDDDQITYLLP